MQLAEELSERYPEKQFIPLFWLESEDADFDEVASLNYLDNDNEIKQFTYSDSGNLSIGSRTFSDGINGLNPLFKINSKFRSGEKWHHAFYDYFKDVFNEYGIVTFRSNDNRIRQHLEPFWKIVLNRHTEIKTAVKQKSNQLENDGFSLQFKYRDEDSFVFCHTATERKKIDDLKEIDSTMPLSPNAILRPLMQDFIFPTLAYIAGPGEIAYHMQITDAYTLFKRSQPIIYPRTHIRILNAKTRRLLQKYKLKENVGLSDIELFKQTAFKTDETDKLDKRCRELENELNKFYQSLNVLDTADQKSRDLVITGSQKRVEKLIKQLENRLLGLMKRKNTDLLEHINYLEQILYPKKKPQERVYPIIQFHKDLVSFSKLIMDQVDILDYDWQIVQLD